MLLGEHRHTVDDKGRLTVPAKFRQKLMAGMVVTRGFDHNLVIYPLDEWTKITDRISELPYSDPDARKIRRLVYSGAANLDVDKQWRVNIPSYLLEYGRISHEVVVVGMNSFAELWSPEDWSLSRQQMEEDQDSEHWIRLGI